MCGVVGRRQAFILSQQLWTRAIDGPVAGKRGVASRACLIVAERFQLLPSRIGCADRDDRVVVDPVGRAHDLGDDMLLGCIPRALRSCCRALCRKSRIAGAYLLAIRAVRRATAGHLALRDRERRPAEPRIDSCRPMATRR